MERFRWFRCLLALAILLLLPIAAPAETVRGPNWSVTVPGDMEEMSSRELDTLNSRRSGSGPRFEFTHGFYLAKTSRQVYVLIQRTDVAFRNESIAGLKKV